MNRFQVRTITREPVAIGFYPGDPDELRDTVEELLEESKVQDIVSKGLVVPHAGYSFSGDTASYAYKTLKGRYIDKVIMLGPNHYGTGYKISISDQKWKNPLGVVKPDKEIIEKIVENSDAEIDNSAHKREHSLEVQIPFLQVVLEDFEIVPISIRHDSLNPADMETLGEAISSVLDDNTLVIASSDLIHFGPNYRYMPVNSEQPEFVKEKDTEFIDKVVQFDPEGVIKIGEDTTVCGYGAITALIHSLDDRCEKASLLKHKTSFEKTEDRNNIVGYASIAFF